jgi:predicted RND superfamily exporter protein
VLIALGLLFAFVLSVTFVPAATAWHDRRSSFDAAPPSQRPAGASSRAHRALRPLVLAGLRHPAAALAVVLLLTGAALVAASALPTTFSYRDVAASDLEVSRALDAAEGQFPGSLQRVYIVVEGDIAQPSVFLALGQVEEQVRGSPFVAHSLGEASVESAYSHAQQLAAQVRLLGAAQAGAPAGFAQAFASADEDGDGRLTAADNLTRPALDALLESMRGPPAGAGATLVGPDDRGSRLAVVVVEVKTAVEHGDEVLAALEHDAAPLQAFEVSPYVWRVTVTGLPLLNREVMRSVQDSGWQSLVITLVLAAILLTALFWMALGSRALGALTVVPALVAVAWTLGAMAALGLSLNMMTVMIATTTVGMGDLYAIHVAHAFYRHRAAGQGAAEAAHSMVDEAGAPLLEAAATTALGFLVLVASPVPVVQSYGLIFAVAVGFAFAFAALLMPILIQGLLAVRSRALTDLPPAPDP